MATERFILWQTVGRIVMIAQLITAILGVRTFHYRMQHSDGGMVLAVYWCAGRRSI